MMNKIDFTKNTWSNAALEMLIFMIFISCLFCSIGGCIFIAARFYYEQYALIPGATIKTAISVIIAVSMWVNLKKFRSENSNDHQ